MASSLERKNICILLFTDDIAILARTESDLQKMLNVVHEWCQKWRLNINQKKSKIIHFRFKGKLQSTFQFKCGDVNIDYIQKYKYLGMWLQENLDHAFAVKHLSNSASRALGSLTAKFYQTGGMSYTVFTKLYESLVVPVFTYGAGIWGLKKYVEIDKIQLRATKSYLGLQKTASNQAAIGDIGWSSTYTRQIAEVYRMHVRLSNMNNHRVTKCIYKHSKKYQSSLDQEAIHVFKNYDIDCHFTQYNTKLKAKKQIKSVVETLKNFEQQNWLKHIWDDSKNQENGNKLRLYRLYKERVVVEKYLELNMPRHYKQLLARFRSGCLPIRIETGRYDKTPLIERCCSFCTGYHLEDELHVLLNCELYSDLRYDLIQHMSSIESDFKSRPILAQFLSIMTTDSVQFILAKYIFTMYKRRKIHDLF